MERKERKNRWNPFFSFLIRKPKLFHLHGIQSSHLTKHNLSVTVLNHIADFYIAISRQMEKYLVEIGIAKDSARYVREGHVLLAFSKMKENMI